VSPGLGDLESTFGRVLRTYIGEVGVVAPALRHQGGHVAASGGMGCRPVR
jgi:hypothetical protein